jgi:predicted MFS family arabinose efflux permease
MLDTYRRALALPGAWQFSATGFVARLPISMVGLGIVLFISTQTGSYAQAGALSAAFQVSAAIGALATSRWADRAGQHRLLPWLGLVNAVALVAFVACVERSLPVAVQAAVLVIAGASQPAIGSMVRARWAHAAPDAERLRSAFALESVIDELIFTIGPLVTAVLAFQLALPAPVVVGAVIGLVGALALSVQRSTEPPASGHRAGAGADPDAVEREHGRRGALAMPGLVIVVVGALGIGGVFGTYEVTVVAFTEQAGQAGASGLVLALWAVGSMLGGLVFGARHWQVPLARQVMVLTGVLALVLLPVPFLGTIPVLTVFTFVAGVSVAPALIAIFSLTERLVPPALLTEGLTWSNSGLAIGFSVGTSAAGAVVDAFGTTWAFALAILCATSSFVVAVLGQGVLMRASAGRRQPPPTAALNTDPLPGPAPGGVVDDPGEPSQDGDRR